MYQRSLLFLYFADLLISESALTRCQIAEIEAADVRQKYAGKRASRANRTKLSEARVVDNVEMVRLK